jgi:putative ABC transport system permease protein
MALPLKYNYRNVLIRWRTTLFTVVGVAAVVSVVILLKALAKGIESSSARTGEPGNLLIVRKGSQAESGSLVTRDQFRTLQFFEEIDRNAAGQPVVSAELVMIINAPRRGGAGSANTLIRGVTPRGLELRPKVRLVEGRWFNPGQREVTVSRKLAGRFEGFEVGGVLKAGPDRLKVVGLFEAGGSAFDSEAWMDADEARAIFDRSEMYSSILLRPRDEAAMRSLTNRIAQDKRLGLRVEPETDYYAQQTATAVPFNILAGLLGTAMSVGAVFAAMNTMYANVASRTREIGTLRVLGYSRGAVVVCFLIEGVILSGLGGLVGCGLSLAVYTYVVARGVTFGTMDFQSFAETVYQFRVTPDLMLLGLAFSMAIGLVGSFLPALRASRLPVISALKSL